MTRSNTDWNATAYQKLATPHEGWGKTIVERLALEGHERVLDAGCGTGKLTVEILERLPDGHVIATDVSPSMIADVRGRLTPEYGERVSFIQSDLLDLQLDEPVDAIASSAVFHWVPDHEQLFQRLFDALKPGGRLVAQCGGGPNIKQITDRAGAILSEPVFARHIGDWPGPWLFASPEETAQRLEVAGFVEIETWLQSQPVTLPDAATYRSYLETVVFNQHLARIPDPALQSQLLDRLTNQAQDDVPPLTLDYWRLNINARRPIS